MQLAETRTDRPPRRGALVTALHLVAIGVVALLLRGLDLGGYLTVDETTTWVPNSYRFLRVLQTGDYAATPFMGHPAITTMWLGSAGVVLRRALFEWGLLHHETYALVLALNRLPTVLVNTGCVLAGYGLLRRVVPPSTAALAAFLWATDPFIIAFSRVLHMDALMGGFATLSLLSAWAYWTERRGGGAAGRRSGGAAGRRSGGDARTRGCEDARQGGASPPHRLTASLSLGWLVLSGVMAGLAVLSKLPALGLFPMMVLIAAVVWWRSRPAGGRFPPPRVLVALVVPLLLWGAITLGTVVALWPTFWTNPVRAYEALRYGMEVEGGNPHLEGNYFLGRHVDDPGPLFYPVALVMRTTPITLLGLVLLPLAAWAGGREQGVGSRGQGAGSREQGAGDRGQGTGDRGQGTGVRGQGSGGGSRLSALGSQAG